MALLRHRRSGRRLLAARWVASAPGIGATRAVVQVLGPLVRGGSQGTCVSVDARAAWRRSGARAARGRGHPLVPCCHAHPGRPALQAGGAGRLASCRPQPGCTCRGLGPRSHPDRGDPPSTGARPPCWTLYPTELRAQPRLCRAGPAGCAAIRWQQAQGGRRGCPLPACSPTPPLCSLGARLWLASAARTSGGTPQSRTSSWCRRQCSASRYGCRSTGFRAWGTAQSPKAGWGEPVAGSIESPGEPPRGRLSCCLSGLRFSPRARHAQPLPRGGHMPRGGHTPRGGHMPQPHAGWQPC
jgi:hypothetical protein